jgi:hypothetical protein
LVVQKLRDVGGGGGERVLGLASRGGVVGLLDSAGLHAATA